MRGIEVVFVLGVILGVAVCSYGVKLHDPLSPDNIQKSVSEMMADVDKASRQDSSSVAQAEDYLKAEQKLMSKLNFGGMAPLKGVMKGLNTLTQGLPALEAKAASDPMSQQAIEKESKNFLSVGSNSNAAHKAAEHHTATPDAPAADAFVSVDAEIQEPTPRVHVPGWPTLKENDQGKIVHALQYLLRDKGVLDREPTGVYDDKTEAAVKKFQNEQNIVADGVVASKTWVALTEGGLVKYGCKRADAVRAVQYLLLHRFGEPAQVNGQFGEEDVTLLRHFQRMRYKPSATPPKGVVGPVTWRMLLTLKDDIPPLDLKKGGKAPANFKIIERTETLSEMVHDVIMMLKAMNAANQTPDMVANEICLVLQNKFDKPDAHDHTVGCTDGREHCAKGFLAVLDAVRVQTMHKMDKHLEDCTLTYGGSLVKDVKLD
eukprot:TRINITY_DN7079_c0_g1_i1.p1 TRINITY_DN7079_c0_g1~~TRINITY_DN7079_c0_g1_i1.p1  ORF type:complete len:431 (-),score=121.74 TRINITY_DN7079_c0_g1_i1:208-1500(-)